MEPPVFYKYLDPQRTMVLANRQIRFTPPDQLNDPYESLPLVSGPTLESVRERIGWSGSLNDAMSGATPLFQTRGPGTVHDEVSRSFGVLCLASAPDHPLLWAHYGASHFGFAIGFDARNNWFHTCSHPTPPLDEVRPVVYQVGRPTVEIGRAQDLGQGGLEQLALGALYTKGSAWSHEQEWRLTRPLELATAVLTGEDGEPVHLFRYPAECVVEVVIGMRADARVIAAIREAVRVGQLSRARVRRAQLSTKTYNIEIVDDVA